MTEIDLRALRRALGSYMTGVTVVTARTPGGEPVGFTANSFTSVSLDPPLLLVCPGRHLTSFDVFAEAGEFAVSVLAEGQEHVSNVFASTGSERFARISWQADARGVPLIDGACAWFGCRVHQRHAAGDHLILVGEIVEFAHASGQGLGYGGGGYFSLGRERRSEASVEAGRRARAGVLLEHEGRLLVAAEDEGYRLPAIDLAADAGPRSALDAYLAGLGLRVSLGPVYSVYDDRERRVRTTFFRARAVVAETAGLGRFVPIDALGGHRFVDGAEASMLERYRSEHALRDFGFYLGTHEAGEVHRNSDAED